MSNVGSGNVLNGIKLVDATQLDLIQLESQDDLQEEPLAITFDERAAALHAVVGYLNKDNQVRGSAKVPQVMHERYGERAQEVQAGAEANRDDLLTGFHSGIDTLAAVSKMRANGYDEDTIEWQRMSLQIDINRTLGRRATAGRRNKVVATAHQPATDVVNGRKRPQPRRNPQS